MYEEKHFKRNALKLQSFIGGATSCDFCFSLPTSLFSKLSVVTVFKSTCFCFQSYSYTTSLLPSRDFLQPPHIIPGPALSQIHGFFLRAIAYIHRGCV